MAGNLSLLDQINIKKSKFPMDASQALLNFTIYLSEYEKTEILEFDKVYFINLSSTKTQLVSNGAENNYGFDNEKGEFICEAKDHIAYRYEIKKNIGNGSFG
jgi:dual specificity tyrosine-phosphorylation-regulated kinase 2/3/4